MGVLIVNEAKEALHDDLTALKEYARRAVAHGETLAIGEQRDVAVRLWEAFAIGASFTFTKRDITVLVLRDVLSPRARCGCPSCRARERRHT